MKNASVALVVGFIFSFGLSLSGMTQPQKVIGFLDVFGKWDPSLIFVMVGAIAVHFVSYRLILKRPAPLFSNKWHVPDHKSVTPALVLGSVLFGIGWGIAGYCPGPAVASLASFDGTTVLFVASMLVGMMSFRLADKQFKFRK